MAKRVSDPASPTVAVRPVRASRSEAALEYRVLDSAARSDCDGQALIGECYGVERLAQTISVKSA